MRRTASVTLFVALLLSLVVLSATASAERTAVPAPAIVKVAFNKKLKESILVDGRGLTVYVFALDARAGRARFCYDDALYHCSKIWPPLRTKGAPRAGPGAKRSLLGVVKHPDGGVQVTYNGHPLYMNAGSRDNGLIRDKKPGDVNGQGFAGLWSVVSPKGAPIRD